MIPTTDNICDLWQKAASVANHPEPYLFATEHASDPEHVITATYVETDEGGATQRAAFHLWHTGEAHCPSWVAVAQPAYHADLTDAEWRALRHGDLAERFAAGDERVHDVLVVHVVTLDGTWSRVYTQPLLEPRGDVIVNGPSEVAEELGDLLVAMHRPLDG